MATLRLMLLGCCLMLQGLVYKLVKIDCEGNPARITNISCHVKAINWNLALANMDSFLILPVRKAIMHLQVFKKDYSNQYKPFLIDVSVNMCEVIEKISYIPYGLIIWQILKQYTNVNYSCPFKGQLTARNGYLETRLLPPFPQGFYLVSVSMMDINSTSNEYVGTAKFYVEAMERIKIKKRSKV